MELPSPQRGRTWTFPTAGEKNAQPEQPRQREAGDAMQSRLVLQHHGASVGSPEFFGSITVPSMSTANSISFGGPV
jgi:hypothetical protein